MATDYHINETPMLEQEDHFKQLYDNPTYIRPEDWLAVDKRRAREINAALRPILW